MVTKAPHWAIPILRVLAWGVLVQCSARACSRPPRVSRATCLRPYASAGCFDVGPPPFFAPSPLLPRQRRIIYPPGATPLNAPSSAPATFIRANGASLYQPEATPQECFLARPPSTAPGHRPASIFRAQPPPGSLFRANGASVYQPGATPEDHRPPNIPRAKGPPLSQRRSPSGEAPPQVRNRRRRTQYPGQLPSPSTGSSLRSLRSLRLNGL